MALLNLDDANLYNNVLYDDGYDDTYQPPQLKPQLPAPKASSNYLAMLKPKFTKKTLFVLFLVVLVIVVWMKRKQLFKTFGTKYNEIPVSLDDMPQLGMGTKMVFVR